MDTKILQADIKANIRKPVYLLYGEERYLVQYYAHALGNGFDKDVFDASATPTTIMLAAQSFPFLAEKRAIHVRDSRLFATGRKADSEQMAEYLSQIPEDTVLIFTEAEIDKRTRLYKKTAELGRVIDCAPLPASDLMRWVAKRFREKGKTISPAVAEQLMRFTAHNMTALVNEIDKLSAYVGERPSIEAADITALCFPTLQTRIFDLLAAMGKGDTARSLLLYAQMLQMKEQPLMILAMLIRQFRILLQCKTANEQKMPRAEMAKLFGLRPFMIDEALTQAKRYPDARLLHALADCQDTDLRIKTGKIDAAIGVELLIIQYTMTVLCA